MVQTELYSLCKNYLEILKYMGSGLYSMDDKREKIHNDISMLIYDNTHPNNTDAAIERVSIFLHDLPNNITAKEMEIKIDSEIEYCRTAGTKFGGIGYSSLFIK